MKKITAEEAKALGILPMGYKHPVRAMIETLEPGELLHITRSEFSWKGKTPSMIATQVAKTANKKFKTFSLPDKKGWVVERVE